MSDCFDCINYKSLYLYCFTCSSFVCQRCLENYHGSHDITEFQNANKEWQDRTTLKNMIGDVANFNDIFEEVSRNLLALNDCEDNRIKDDDWECESCTLLNRSSSKQCCACNFFRKNVYDKPEKLRRCKLEFVPSLETLDSSKVQAIEYTCEGFLGDPGAIDISSWYRRHVAPYDERIFNIVLAKSGHKLGKNNLDKRCKDLSDTGIRRMKKLVAPYPTAKALFGADTSRMSYNSQVKNRITNSFGTNQHSDDGIWKFILGIGEDSFRKIDQRHKRMLTIEMYFKDAEKAEFLVNIMRQSEYRETLNNCYIAGTLSLLKVHETVRDNYIMNEAMAGLIRTCGICCDAFPNNYMQNLLTCEHELCKGCFLETYMECIAAKPASKWVCSMCEDGRDIDRNLDNNRIREILMHEIQRLKKDKSNNEIVEKMRRTVRIFDSKLLNERLGMSENFHWCPSEKCQNGFESIGINRIQCPSCKGDLCGQCGRKWDKKHEGLSCEEFELRLLKDDPDLANVLNDIGIECPNCHMRYAMAAGGILHFDCTSCGKSFCGGCSNFFVKTCGVANCPMTDYHAHHPRNCLYYLRDNDVVFLEGMLQGQDYTQLGGKPEKKCSFKITNKALKDADCGVAVIISTGFCEQHYKEYLITFITKLGIDPADFAKTSHDLNMMLFQAKLPKLEKIGKETEPQFMARIKQHVKTNCKLYVPRGAVGVVGGGD